MRLTSLLIPLLLAAACSSGPPRSETRRYPVVSFDQDYEKVKEATRLALRANRFPIETQSASGFDTGVVPSAGFSWRLRVPLGRGTDYVSVGPTLDITRDRSIRPLRGALTNMGKMSNEGEPNADPEPSRDDMREDRIRDLNERVYAFLQDLESRLNPEEP